MRRYLKQRGLGQTPTATTPVTLPSCTSMVAQSIPQAVLIGGGGLATLVGVIGAIVSDQYKEDFAIAAGVGLLASFAGGVWASSTIAGCGASAVQASAATSNPTSTIGAYAPGYSTT
jgi:hypothetical protein